MCGSRVTGIQVAAGRAVGVGTEDGDRIAVRRAVVTDVHATALYGRLAAEQWPCRRGSSGGCPAFQLDPGTVKVDWALSGPVPWASAPPVRPGTVHVADDLGRDGASTRAICPPASSRPSPFLLVGQMTTADSTRSPDGTESMWAYTHVPQRRRAATRGTRASPAPGRTTIANASPTGCRHGWSGWPRASGAAVLARRVLGPRELEARNENLIGGAVNGGTSQLHQQLVLRPVPGWGRAETGVPGLYLASASAHPGGGVHGAAGMNAARAALLHHRLRLGRR